MRNSKWMCFLRKYSRNIIAFATVLALILSASSISSLVMLFRSIRSQESAEAEEPPQDLMDKIVELLPKPGSKPETESSDTTSTTEPTTPTPPAEDLTPEQEMERAVTILTEAIEKDPSDSELYTQRAALYYNLGDSESAIADYTSSLEIKDAPRTHYLRAIVYTVSGNNSAAYEDLSAALKALPNHPDYLSLMADVCNALQRFGEALDCLRNLLAVDPTNCTLHTLAGDACVYLGYFTDAVSHYEQAIAYYSDDIQESGITKLSLYNAYANSLKTLNRFPEAAEAYSRCLSYYESKDLYFQRGFCLLQSENFDDAAADFTKCIEMGYETVLSHFQRGLCQYARENYYEAIDDFKIFEEAFPDSTDTILYMGLCYQNIEQYEPAITYYNKCIQANISPGTCYFNVGNCYYNLEDYTSAIPNYTSAIDHDVYVYESLLNRGICYIQNNKYNEAKADLKRVIDECSNPTLVESAKQNYDPIKNITIITSSSN